MTGEAVLEFLDLLAGAGIEVWIDGGWGVDALVGRETRPHADLDVVVRLDRVPDLRRLLESRGFAVSEEELPTRFVMRHPDDRRVDFHTVTFDEGGGGVQIQQDGSSFRYPPEGFRASGSILGRPVPCLTAEVQMLCHTGYDPDETDRHDVKLLHDHFGLSVPTEYSD